MNSSLRSTEFWERAAKKDPYYFITNKKYRRDSEFFASGIVSIDKNLAEIFPDKDIEDLSFDSILEIGCGVGRESFYLCDFGKRLYGIDISKTMIKKAIEFQREYDPADKIRFEVTNGINFKSFDDSSFDFVYSNITMQHTGDIATVFSNLTDINRILRSDGVAAVLIRTKELKKDIDHNPMFDEIDTPPISEKELLSFAAKAKFRNPRILPQREVVTSWLVWGV